MKNTKEPKKPAFQKALEEMLLKNRGKKVTDKMEVTFAYELSELMLYFAMCFEALCKGEDMADKINEAINDIVHCSENHDYGITIKGSLIPE